MLKPKATVSSSWRSFTGYSLYGYEDQCQKSRSLMGFNAEHLDSVSGCYLLGNGHRAYSPVMMRFLSCDRLSPFGAGGINPYTYCVGDPVNRLDPGGAASVFREILRSVFLNRKTREQRREIDLRRQEKILRVQEIQAQNNFVAFEDMINQGAPEYRISRLVEHLQGLPSNDLNKEIVSLLQTTQHFDGPVQYGPFPESILPKHVRLINQNTLMVTRSPQPDMAALSKTELNIWSAHTRGALNKQLQKKLKYLRQGPPGHRGKL